MEYLGTWVWFLEHFRRNTDGIRTTGVTGVIFFHFQSRLRVYNIYGYMHDHRNLSGPAGPVLAGPDFTFDFKIAHDEQ